MILVMDQLCLSGADEAVRELGVGSIVDKRSLPKTWEASFIIDQRIILNLLIRTSYGARMAESDLAISMIFSFPRETMP